MCRIKKIRKDIRRYLGVTFIELLITISLVSIIGITILSAFTAGYKAIAKAQSYYGSQTDILISLEKIERDLRNAFNWKGIGFQGSSSQVSFPSLVNQTNEDLSEELVLGTISYSISSVNSALIRKEYIYPQSSSSDRFKEEMLAKVESISFNYYFLDKVTNKMSWKNTWEDESLPLGVKVTVSYKDLDKYSEISRTILLHS